MLGRFHLRYATSQDAERCQQIARQHRQWLPFVMLPQLRESASKREMLVGVLDNQIVGFSRYHQCRDGFTTLYDLAVDNAVQGMGIGRALLHATPAPIRLKCTSDNPANSFYEHSGMAMADTETTRTGRLLNRYQMLRPVLLVAGRNAKFAEIAQKSGMSYGARDDYKPSAWPFMLDINWRDYDFPAYLELLRQQRPAMAMVPDYEKSNKQRLYQQIRAVKQTGVLRVLVCPKFVGAVAHIPSWCIVAVSVFSGYAGFEPDPRELVGRRLHLLGGGVADWWRCMDKYHASQVVSMDGSMFTIWADYGRYWSDGRQVEVPYHEWKERGAGKNYELAVCSGQNIVRETANRKPVLIADLPLFQGEMQS